MAMFTKLLIANRGEIACRIIRTARRMGLYTIAVHSDADASAMHVAMADIAMRIGPAAPRESYLRIDAILDDVSAADARLRACAVVLNVISADGTAADIERALFSHVLQRWGLTPESLNTGLRRLRKTDPEHAPH